MFSKYLSSIDGISIYPVVVLILFFTIFMVVLIYLWKMDKTHVERMSALPLDSNNEIENNFEKLK